jgi:hypothetical protein
MSDTIGELIDKLTISNIRLWMLEDQRRVFCNSDTVKSNEEVKQFLKKVSSTNKERNVLIDQINACCRIIYDNSNDKSSTLQITIDEILGSGKNKFYKTEDI